MYCSRSAKLTIRRGFVAIAVSIIMLFSGAPSLTTAQSSDNDSYKGDFIVKLPNYVEWPAGKGPDASGAVTIGVIGTPSCLEPLETAAAARTADGKKTEIRSLAIGDDYSGCQIIFFQTCDKAELAQILKKVGALPILTVADCAGFAKFGVMMSFFEEVVDGKSKVKFEVNTLAAGDAQLKINSNLLKLAKII
jgi:hypothetical protein